MPKKTLEETELIDDFLFDAVMKDKETARMTLERLLDMEISGLEYASTQETLKNDPSYKGSRYDLYVTDKDGVVYDVEVQTTKSSDMGKRLRYYQSLIDYRRIHAGAVSFHELPKSIIIFICDFDPFDKGLCRYTFRHTCAEDPSIISGDDAKRIIFNARGTVINVNKAQKRFLDYIRDSSAVAASEDKLISRLNAQIANIKQDPERRREFMSFEEKLYEREKLGREEGLKEGMKKGMQKGIQKGFKDGEARGREAERLRMVERLRKKGMSDTEIEELLAS